MNCLDKSLVLFDVDSLEYRPTAPDCCPALPDLALRPRMLPLAERLNALYAFARERAHPLLFSVCCSGQVPDPEAPGIARIPAQDERAAAAVAAGNERLYYAEKVWTDHRRDTSAQAMFDKFARNGGLRAFVLAFGARHWVVFGNGAALCVQPAIRCLLDAGQPVTILADVLVDNAGPDAAGERRAMLANFAQEGTELLSFADFCRRHRIGDDAPASAQPPATAGAHPHSFSATF
jgi:hypothetical protein